MKKNYVFVLLILSVVCHAQTIERGPYLNSVTSSSATIRWRTNKSTNSEIFFGTSLNSLQKKKADGKTVADHEVLLTGLIPSTKYFYTIGSSRILNPDQYFQTAPEIGSSAPVRIWALGDFGNGSKNQIDCRDAILNATTGHRPDVWIWLGDNAYDYGRDDEYQKHVFDVYQSFFKNTALYPSPGNHEYRGRIKGEEIPYFKIFTMPQQGESGGVPSGSESYYSFDYGNVHFVSLDSYEVLNDKNYLFDTLSLQVSWLKKDLATNKLPWTVLYWHYPPYTKCGSHDSDTEEALVKIRQNLVPVLERYKVDLVLSGHSHVYERTYPILGHYGLADTFDPGQHIVGKSDSLNTYHIGTERQGIIYIVNGAGGQIDDQEKGSPLKAAVYYNNSVGGSMILDVAGNRLDAQWICADGVVRDRFSIIKENAK